MLYFRHGASLGSLTGWPAWDATALRLGRCGWLAAPIARQLRMEADRVGLLTNDDAELALVVAVVGDAGGLGFFPVMRSLADDVWGSETTTPQRWPGRVSMDAKRHWTRTRSVRFRCQGRR